MFHPSYKRNLPLLAGAEFFGFFGITALWLLFLSQQGMSLLQIGLLESIFHATSFLSEVPSGILADRFSYKANLLVSRLMIILASILMLLGQGNFWIYAVSMIIQAWSYNFDSGTSLAFLYESAVEAGLKHKYLRYASFFSGVAEVTRTLGLVAAAFFVHGFMEWTYGIQIFLSLISICLIVMTKGTSIKQPGEPATHLGDILSMVQQTFKRNPRLLSWLGFSQFFGVLMCMFYFYYQNELTDLGTWQISFVMMLSSGANVAAVWLASRIGQRWSAQGLFPWILLMVGGLYLLAYLETPSIYMLVFILSDAFFAFFQPIFNDDLQGLLDSRVRATMLSVNSMFFSLFMVLIFPLTGWAIDQLGFSITFSMLGILLCSSAFLVTFLKKGKRYVT